MWNQLLPIGSVVLLKESEKRVMVMGFCQAKPDNLSVIYDYCGCLFPEGYMDAEHVYLFDHEQVEKVYSLGYMDEEQFAFSNRITDLINDLRNGVTPGNSSETEEDEQ